MWKKLHFRNFTRRTKQDLSFQSACWMLMEPESWGSHRAAGLRLSTKGCELQLPWNPTTQQDGNPPIWKSDEPLCTWKHHPCSRAFHLPLPFSGARFLYFCTVKFRGLFTPVQQRLELVYARQNHEDNLKKTHRRVCAHSRYLVRTYSNKLHIVCRTCSNIQLGDVVTHSL